MALSFHPTTASLFGHHRPLPAPDAAGMGFLQPDDDDGHSEVTDALLGFVYDPLDDASNIALDDLLRLPLPQPSDAAFLAPLDGAATGADWPCGNKRQRCIGTASQQQVLPMPETLINDECVLRLPLPTPPAVSSVPVPVPTQVPEPLVFVRGADVNKAAAGGGGACETPQKSVARQRRKRISEKTAELARLIPGAHKLNTAEMLEEAARHVKLLQAQVGVLALMRAAGSSQMLEVNKMPSAMAAQERMHALLGSGSVQERLAAEGKCLVPTCLVDAVAKDDAVKANPVVRRNLGRFVASLKAPQGQ